MSDTSNPVVSVIIPTYNRGSMILEPIRSILNQSYENIELIVVDDGSTDNTENILKQVDDERFQYIIHNENKGPNASRNTGLKHSSGKYVSFVDSDVTLIEDKIEKQVEIMTDSSDKVGIVYCSGYRKHGDYLKEVSKAGLSGDIYSDLLALNIKITTSTMFIDRKCFEECGKWDPDLPSFNEYDLCLRFAKEFEFKYIAEPLIIEKSHNKGNITSNIDRRTVGMNGIVDKWGDEMKKYHGENAVAEFQKRSRLLTYKEASIWNAKNGKRRKGVRLAYEYLRRCEGLDTRYLMNFAFSLFGSRAHSIIKKKWYKKTGVNRNNVTSPN